MSITEEMIFPVKINEEVEQSFLDYSVSVITDRALPDVRDGMKPVHRRIIYAMNQLKLSSSKPHRKSAQVVGEVLAHFHPHGDLSVYEAMVRLSQDFSLNYPLVDGHGNFGNIDGDPAAAYRYTEARLSKIGEQMLRDIDKETVDWKPNFSEDTFEPVVLPARLPQLLINGTSGIAVGMACSFVPHNLEKIIDAIESYIDNPDISIAELLRISGGPDFPTGGQVINKDELLKGYTSGRGRVRIRAKHKEETRGKKNYLVFYEIPYMTKKSKIVEDIAKLAEEKEIEGITDVRDESAKDIRIVVELAKGYSAEVVAEILFAKTQLENTYSINNTCLVDGQPKTLSFKELIQHYVEFQQEIVRRRTQFNLNKVNKRIHILEGLVISLTKIEEVIAIIRGSNSTTLARETLMKKLGLTETQAKSVLAMRLSSLTKLEIQSLKDEKKELEANKKEYIEILEDEHKLNTVLLTEIKAIGSPHYVESATDITQINITPEERAKAVKIVEDVNISINIDNIVSFVTDKQFKSKINKEQSCYQIATNTGEDLVVFMSDGKVYRVPVEDLKAGDSLVRVIGAEPGAKLINVLKNKDKKYIAFLTASGMLKKTSLSEYDNIRRTGIIGIRLREGDSVVSIEAINEEPVIVMSSSGQTIRFATKDIKPTGRNSMGVIAIKLEEGESAVDFATDSENKPYFLTLSKNGMIKKTNKEDFPFQNRNGKGVKGMKLSESDEAFMIKEVEDKDEIIVFSEGRMVKSKVKDLSAFSRNSVGNIIIKDGFVTNINLL